jgi:prepilin-type N-terminal cleavage/methylation domain-containing protein
MQRKGFTLIEAIIVIVIMGILVAMTAPKLSGVLGRSEAELNRAQMLKIKEAALLFYGDTGFAPDNVSLLLYPYTQTCSDAVAATNWNDANTPGECRNLIAFLDSHYKAFGETGALRANAGGDNGPGTERTAGLIDILRKKLDAKAGGWRGGYLDGNAYLDPYHVRPYRHSVEVNETNGTYWVGQRDVGIYFEDKPDSDLYDALGLTDQTELMNEWYPVSTEDFDSDLDDRYDVAKYRGNRLGDPLVLDPYGTPYELQIPLNASQGGSVPDNRARTRFARIVSFGPDRRRQTDVRELYDGSYPASSDDSVLYLFETNAGSRFWGIE